MPFSRRWPDITGNIVPCKVDGTLLGPWRPATAGIENDPALDRKVDRLLGQQCGLMKILFGVASALQGRKYTILELKVKE
jgi:hypothetical protein